MTKIKYVPPRPIHISAKGVHLFVPEALKASRQDALFHFHIPTYAQRDTLSQLVFTHGCIPPTPEHGRAVLVSELFEVYAPDPSTAPPRLIDVEIEDPDHPGETKMIVQEVPRERGDPDEIASFLEGFYQRQEVFQEILSNFVIQKREQLLDEIHSGKPTPEKDVIEMPPAPYTAREAARVNMITMNMLRLSSHFRQFQAGHADYDAREDLMLFRIFCAGWEGMETTPVHMKSGLVAESAVERLREELAMIEQHPPEPPAGQEPTPALELGSLWKALIHEVRQLMVIDKEQEKNSVSPPGNGSSPDGSQAGSADLMVDGGEWTESTTGPTPDSGSQTTSGTSSSSQSAPAKRKPRHSRTAKP